MNALQPSRPPLKPVESNQVSQRVRRYRRRRPYRAMALETTVKVTVNVVLSAAAVAGLVKLVPYQLAQQEKLQELRTEVEQAETRVSRLQSDFSRYFDPRQARSIMQEQSNRIAPGQRQVFLLEHTKKAAPAQLP